MKKSLIALAALAATASFAQSSVQIDGILDAGYQAIDYKGQKVNGIGNNGSSTSQINFRGTEDLGGGLKANFRVETDWNTVSNKGNTGSVSSPVTLGNETVAAASSFANGEIRVGLAGGFGAVDAGVVNYNTLGTYLTGQPFGTAIGGGFRALAVTDTTSVAASAVRSDNSIKYVTPSFSGLTGSLYYAARQSKAVDMTATTTTAATVKSTSFSTSLGAYDMQGTTEVGVNYANGPLAASFSSLKQDYNGVGANAYTQTLNTLGANYAIGAAKVFGLYQTNKKNDNSAKTEYYSLSASYTMGATTLMAQVGQFESKAGANNGKKSDLVGLGADYALSKRTALYARYEAIDDKAGVVANPGTLTGTNDKRTRTAIGVRHSF